MIPGDPANVAREIEREREREHRLLQAIDGLSEEEQRLESELSHVDGQVTYYDSLARDMKRTLSRPGLSVILRSLRR